MSDHMDDTVVNTEVAGNTSGNKDTKRSRAWCITINNYTEMDRHDLEEDTHKYLVYQTERGEKGTLHIQAYMYFKNPVTFSRMKKRYSCAHLEVARGSAEQNKNYCTKEDSRVDGPWEFGEMPNQGKRTDLQDVGLSILGGKTVDEIAVDEPGMFIKYHRGLRALEDLSTIHRNPDFKKNVYWYWGLAGVGKTKKALEFGNCYIKDGTMWWDGYRTGMNIVIDDFDGKWPFRDLLRLLDRYPYQGQVKGGYVKINGHIIITCEYPPEHFWTDNELAQISRRITHVEELVK